VDRRAAPPAAGPSRHGAGRRGRHRVLAPACCPAGMPGHHRGPVRGDAADPHLQCRPRGLNIDSTDADAASPSQTRPSMPSSNTICYRPRPDPGMALAAWRAAAPAAEGPGGRLALLEGSSGDTSRPLSPRISMKHPGRTVASCNGRAEHAIMCYRAKCKLTVDMCRIVGREDGDSASGPASAVLWWCGAGVGSGAWVPA
jgi:hypothetical protein